MIWTILIVAAILIPVTAWAVSMQDPQDYSIITYCWVSLTAMGGCLVSILTNIREGRTRIFNIAEIIGELFIAGFSGVVTFWCCELIELPQLATVICIAIIGHMGSRGMAWFEHILTAWVAKRLGIDQPTPEPQPEIPAEQITEKE